MSRSSDLSSIEEEEEVTVGGGTIQEPLEPVRSLPSSRLTSRPIATYPRSAESWQRGNGDEENAQEASMLMRFHAPRPPPPPPPPPHHHQYCQARCLPTTFYHGMITSGEKRPHDMSESISLGSLGIQKDLLPEESGGRSPLQPPAPKRIILSDFSKPDFVKKDIKPFLYSFINQLHIIIFFQQLVYLSAHNSVSLLHGNRIPPRATQYLVSPTSIILLGLIILQEVSPIVILSKLSTPLQIHTDSSKEGMGLFPRYTLRPSASAFLAVMATRHLQEDLSTLTSPNSIALRPVRVKLTLPFWRRKQPLLH